MKINNMGDVFFQNESLMLFSFFFFFAIYAISGSGLSLATLLVSHCMRVVTKWSFPKRAQSLITVSILVKVSQKKQIALQLAKVCNFVQIFPRLVQCLKSVFFYCASQLKSLFWCLN